MNGVVELSWDAATDKVKDHADATAVYARYVKVVFSSVSPDAPSQQVALDEIEILGSSDRMEGAYEPKAEEITGDTDPHYPDNLAYRKSYEVLNASAAGDSSYPDPKKTKLTDGVEATADYLDAPGPPIRKAPTASLSLIWAKSAPFPKWSSTISATTALRPRCPGRWMFLFPRIMPAGPL